MKNQRSPVFAWLCALTLGGAVFPALAADMQGVASFDIAAQPLDTALLEFSKQAGVQVLATAETVRGKNTAGVKGDLIVEKALLALLEGSGLRYRRTSERAVTIAANEQARADATQDLRLAQTESQASPAESVREFVSDIPEILVRGTKSLNTDIPRSPDGIQPYLVFDRATLERSGGINVETFLRQQLPSIASFYSNSQGANGTNGNLSSIDLRGLGDDETLILVDGRRLAGASSGSDVLQPDVNGIPLAAIERIEVLATTASGIYGGGATGGVINIVLKRDYTGAEARAGYRGTFSGGGAVKDAGLNGGHSFEDGRTHAMFAVNYTDTNQLSSDQRNFTRRRISIIERNNPAFFLDSFTPPLAATTNIKSAFGTELTLKNNGPALGSTITSVPLGYAGVASDDGAALVDNAGNYQLAPPESAQLTGDRGSLFNASQVKSFSGSINRDFTSRVSVFLEASASRNRGSVRNSQAESTFFLQGTNAGNPFNEAIVVSTPALGADRTTEFTSDSLRAATGVVVKLGADWRAAADYTWNRTKFSATQAGLLDSGGAGAAISAGTLDIFRDTNGSNVDFGQYLLASPRTSPVESTLTDAALRFSGPLGWSLPGGKPTLSLSYENRRDHFGDSSNETELAPGFVFTFFTSSRWQTVDSVSAELNVPLVSQANALPGVHALDLQLAGRWDQYNTVGANSLTLVNGAPDTTTRRESNEFDSTNPTLGLRYAPVQDVAFRASYSTGFLPAAVNRLVPDLPALASAFFGFTDPSRGNLPIGDFFYTTGGNPDLDPEESKSWSAGAVLTPRALPNLRLSADWIHIRKTGNIVQLGLSQANLNQIIELAPQRVTREDPAPGDPYGVGRITAVDLTAINFASRTLEALDTSADYRIESASLGVWSLSLRATHLLKDRQRFSDIAPELDVAGVPSSGGGIKWRGAASLGWDYRDWLVSWTTRYLSSYTLADEVNLPLLQRYVLAQGSQTIARQIYHDVFASHRFGSLLGKGLEVQLGVVNLFDKKPPFDALATQSGYSPFGDPRGATYYANVKVAF